MNAKTFILLSFFWINWSAFASDYQRYENLHNPTEYIYSVSSKKINSILFELQGPQTWGPLGGGYYKGIYGLGLLDFYTRRYWRGPREKYGAEAGRIGTIGCDFVVRVVPQGQTKTLVSITVERFDQQVGRQYKILPHFREVPVIEEVKSDTYFEYFFLLKLGELVGENDMPQIKGSAEGDTRKRSEDSTG